jgi:hypothetical protein
MVEAADRRYGLAQYLRGAAAMLARLWVELESRMSAHRPRSGVGIVGRRLGSVRQTTSGIGHYFCQTEIDLRPRSEDALRRTPLASLNGEACTTPARSHQSPQILPGSL